MLISNTANPPYAAVTMDHTLIEQNRVSCINGSEPNVTIYRVPDENSPIGFTYRVRISCKQ